MFSLNNLNLYIGKDIKIKDGIVIRQPTLREIAEYGEKEYFNMISLLTSSGADLKAQLWHAGIDYTKIKDYDLFIKHIVPSINPNKVLLKYMIANPAKYEKELEGYSKEDVYKILNYNPTSIIFKDLDFADFNLYEVKDTKQEVLYNKEKDITIDRVTYSFIMQVIRAMHLLKRNNERPGNEATKMDLIRDAEIELMDADMLSFDSILEPMVSSMSVYNHCCGNDRQIWDMNIYRFLENIKRIDSFEYASKILQGMCGGLVDSKKIDKSILNWKRNLINN